MTQQNIPAIDENTVCKLNEFSLIKITGEDARAFLQGQFSNDVNALQSGQCQLNSYNSPKGRMYACFYLLNVDDTFYMIVPGDIVEMLLKRLRMFVMRSKVTLEDISESNPLYGFSGEALLKQLAQKTALPAEAMHVEQSDNHTIALLNNDRAIGFGQDMDDIATSLDATTADNKHWRRLDIHAGIPNIFASSQEEFVAQMVNLPLVGGVSFTKGCYPGQEVVARMHYLGKLKKRMYRVLIDSAELPKPADNVYEQDSDNDQSVGQIVDAQLNEAGTIDALAVLQIKSAEEHKLCLGSKTGPGLSLRSLPYPFEEAKK
ncbi:MAG: folate-binding protein [Gammaproteobacteria bacterium]|nr:folate-binding protein [Gammaproteobacteria bacterium]